MGRPTLWLDSNVARSPKGVRELVTKARPKGIRVVVPAQVHLEICRQVRERTGSAFSPRLVDSFLEQQGIEVIGAQLDRTTAETWAELLNRRYTTSDDWKAAKLASVKAKLPDEALLPASRVPMTTDWWIALAVEHDADAFIAVDDKGEEWRSLREKGRARSFNDTLRWLENQPDVGD
jgi:predicted nucleic acid-binding protein